MLRPSQGSYRAHQYPLICLKTYLCRLQPLNLIYSKVTPNRLPARQRVPRTCTLSTERGCTTSNCSAPFHQTPGDEASASLHTGLFPAGEHTEPTDRASSSTLVGAQSGRIPKKEHMDTPHPCSREAAHMGRKPVGTTGLVLPPAAPLEPCSQNIPVQR